MPATNEHRQRAALDILAERERQHVIRADALDDKNRPADWIACITAYAGRAIASLRDVRCYDDTSRAGYRQMLVKVGALALAAIEAHDKATQP